MAQPIRITKVEADIAKFARAINAGIGIAVERLAFGIHSGTENFDGIIKRMPVDTGRARAGWDVSIGAPSDYVPPPGNYPEPPPFNPKGHIDGTAPVFITNNVVYINPLENGHSKQAPLGFVAITVAAAEAEIAMILRGLKEEAESQAQ